MPIERPAIQRLGPLTFTLRTELLMWIGILSPAIRTRGGWLALLMAAAAVWSGCGDPPTSQDPATHQSPPPRLPSAAMISSPVGGAAFVSMMPGTQASGQRAEIRNLRTGAVISALMSDGGFDPMGIAGQLGDTLSVTVVLRTRAQTIGYGVVPMRLQPMVVRTWPASAESDVPVNGMIRVVFNQPMDGGSLPSALHLLRDGVAVPGTVSGDSTGGVILSGRFVPTFALAPLSVYEVSVSPEARSLNGETLASPVTVQFTTQASAPPPDTVATPGGSIQVNVHTAGAPLDPDGYTVVLDNASSGPAVPVNGKVLLTNVVTGGHRVRLEGAADNCWLRDSKGGVPGSGLSLFPVVSVTRGHTASVTFDLVCLEPGAGAIEVRVERTGDPFSYFTALTLSRSDGLTHTIQPGVFHGVTKGVYQVWLTGGVPFLIQCTVGAPNPRTIDVESESVVTTVFQLSCSNE